MTVAVDVHQRITELPARKRALLAARNPLSFAQERLWFFDQLVPGSALYNLPFALRLEGDLDRRALERALSEVFRRHDALRTTFAAPDGRPMQVVHPPRPAALPLIDLAALATLAADGREARVRALVAEEAGRPFDLTRGPLLRCRLLRLGRREHVLCGAMHHIVSDGWSLEVLIREVSALYTAFAAGAPSPLPELSVQYLDFARWQREQLRGELLREHLGYWKRTLAGAPPVLELPADKPRPQLQSHRGASRLQSFSPAVAGGLRRVGQRVGATSFTTLLAAFMTLLGRLTGSDDIVVGSPVANRTREELEPLIGFFLNMLVLRGDLSGDPAFPELVARMREVVVGAQAHQDLPFEKLVEVLQPERNLGHAPLFQVSFVHLVPPREELSLPGVRLQRIEGETATAMYDLRISLVETERGLASQLEYSTDLFAAATIDRFLRQLDALLGALAADPEQRLGDVPLLSGAERQQLVVEWNDAAAPAPQEATLPGLLAARVARHPEAAAVVCGEAALTYWELQERARRLASHLVGLGIGPETLVGLHAERTPEMLVGLWGILAAGAAYLPLDPALPQERLAWMLEDSRAPVVLTQQSLRGALPAWGGTALCLDGEELTAAPTAAPDIAPDRLAAADPDHLAYVLYTSGSTGRPKGVPITHRNVVNFLGFMGPRLGIAERDTLLAVTTLSFDISVLELVLPLVRGARVALVGPETSADGERLAQAIAHHGATLLQATPATWQLLLQTGWQGREDLRILCGGEALPGDLARQLLERGREVWNLYGPTETTIWSAVHRVGEEAGVAPLGRPIANTSLHVLDRNLRPQPLGVPGELFIGGAGLSRGYLNRSRLAAERFVPDPFAGEPGARLYRTGDLVRRRPDGVLEFLGRTDHQVKLRGFRIELGEIEAVLREHPAVREAAVALRQDQLVGYLVADPAVAAVAALELTGQLRARLQERLPAYMIPAALVALNALPRTPNGKLNRRALPAPADGDFGADDGVVAPRTPLEEAVARVWAELLGREQVGVETSFFELGGHSLLATRLVHRLATDFQVELRLPQLFATPTVAGLAAAIARCRAAGETGAAHAARRSAIVPDPARRGEPFPLNDVQQAYWVGRSAHFALGNVSSHSYTEMDLPQVDVARLERALRRLIERHDMLRAVVLPDGRQQVLAEVPPYEVRVQDLRGADPAMSAAALEQVRAEMSHQVLPADRWPLFEVRASLLDGGLARLHFSLDYLIADAWSMRIIFRDVFRFYGEPDLELAPLELSFRDCVLAERALDASAELERAERYWQERLADLPPAPELPLARDPRELAAPRFARRQARLSAERWSRLKSAAARAGLTPSGVLLGAFSEVLAVWSKSPRFTINVTLFNRPPVHPEIEEVIGDFTTLSLLAVDAARGNTFVLRARGVQEQLWNDMEHRAVSAVRVLRDLARTRGTAPAAIMPVVFTSVLGQGGAEAARADDEADDSSFGISQTPQVWLDHQVVERHGALVFNWDAVEELFPAGLLDDLFAAYCGLLDTLAAEEDWSAVPRPTPGAAQLEVQQAANRTDGPLPDELLHAGFSAWAAREPGRVAVIAPSRTLTYGEVDRLSNQLARRLRELGAQPNQLVAVVMEKGWEQVVAVLAVLKSGAAYLPIDPGLPEKRLQHLLEKGEVQVALTQPRAAGAVAWPAGIERITVGREPLPGISDAALAPVQGPEDLAYVIYTSGSTGLPKGVMIDHRGAVNTVLDVNQRFAIGPEDRTLALSALNFDLSVYDVFGLLAAGGAIVFPDAADLRDPEAWAELIARHGVTVWNTVPALLEMLVEGALADAQLGSLRLALLSGDWIPVTLPDRFRARVDGVEVFSLGGATEASIWSILYPIGEVDPAWPSIPYGKAMRNQRFYVLDHALDPRPLGVPGELYIGGVGVALGYWRDDERTAAQFLRHPRTGERLYRTGDLGRFLPDGNIEFLGREDFQVKIRGHRIELGEIEAALHQIENVRSAVVATAGASANDRRLVAYVVLDQPAPQPPPPAQLPAPAPRAVAAAGSAPESEEVPAFALIRGEGAKLEFKLAEHGLRRDEGLPAVPLAGPALDEALLGLYRERRTHRAFRQVPLPGERLGRLLAALREAGGAGKAQRRYLSPGGAYPVEIHVQVRPGRVEGLAAGVYRYDPVADRLTCTTPGADIDPGWHEAVNQEVARQAAFGIYLIARPEALLGAYGEAARERALLEAGALGQLLMESGPAEGIGLCPIGGIDFPAARGRFGVDPSCVLLHSFLGGAAEGAGREGGETGAPGTPEAVDLAVDGDFLDGRLPAGAFGSWLSALRQVLLPELLIPKYRYASAGALYPVQAYVAVEPGRVEGVEAGVYYYDPKGHRLVQLAGGAEGRPALAAALSTRLPEGAAFSLFLIGRLGAIAPLYGGVARDFCQLEAGYMSQLLAAAGRELGVGLAPAACLGFRESRRAFALDRDHVLLHALAGGPVPVAASAAVEGAARARRIELPDEAARLRGRLAEVLPEYSVPTQIVFLAELPLTANGKVDRQGLPAPGETAAGEAAVQRAAQDPSAAPRSEMERTIAAIWSELLGRGQVGIHDNFFELGGTSVHMIRMRNRLQESIGRTVEVAEFFQHPTVAALARALARSGAEERGAEALAELDDIDERMQKQKSALLRQRMAAQQRMKAAE